MASRFSEVIMLKYFVGEGMVMLSRGAIEITDADKLAAIIDG